MINVFFLERWKHPLLNHVKFAAIAGSDDYFQCLLNNVEVSGASTTRAQLTRHKVDRHY